MTTDVYLGGLPFSNAGALQVFPEPDVYPASAVNVGGVAVDSALGQVYVRPAGSPLGVERPKSFWHGVGVTNNGALYITDDPTTGSFTNTGGMRIRSDGALLVSNAGTPSSFSGGFAFTTTQALIIGGTVPTFGVDFNDLGAGAVNIVDGMGAVTASFTRATTATTILRSGLVASVASGTARSYYDPTSLAYLGYLAEGARTNLCLQSEDFGTTWAVSKVTVSTNATTAPDGAATADALVEDNTVGSHQVTQSFVKAAASVDYAVTVWVKASTRSFLRIFVDDAGGTNGVFADYNVSTGAVDAAATASGAGFTAGTASVKAYPSGWYRLSLTLNSNNAVALRIFLQWGSATGTYSYAGNSATAGFTWGAQLEAATFASSYIPTTVASVTRNADVLTYPTTFLSATAYTWFASITTEWSTLLTNARIVSMRNSGVKLVPLFAQTGAGTGISTTDTLVTPTVAATFNGSSTPVKFASAGGATDSQIAQGGLLGTAAGAQTLAFDGVGIGCNPDGSSSMFGTISRTTYIASRLTNTQLQAITA